MADYLSGNPSSDRPSKIAPQFDQLAVLLEYPEVKTAWEALFPKTCPCCVQSMLEDAALMLREFAATDPGKEYEAQNY